MVLYYLEFSKARTFKQYIGELMLISPKLGLPLTWAEMGKLFTHKVHRINIMQPIVKNLAVISLYIVIAEVRAKFGSTRIQKLIS